MKEIPLTKGKVALVDDEDFARLSQFNWHAFQSRCGGKWYALRNSCYMHREILGAPADQFVDHINRDGLDNRRSNLRLCRPSQNQANRIVPRRGRFRGVQRKGGKFRAVVAFEGKRYRSKLFDVEAQAALAYNWMAREIHGEFAVLNFTL